MTSPKVMTDLNRHIANGEIKPALNATYSLHHRREAQAEFIPKEYAGNDVVIP